MTAIGTSPIWKIHNLSLGRTRGQMCPWNRTQPTTLQLASPSRFVGSWLFWRRMTARRRIPLTALLFQVLLAFSWMESVLREHHKVSYIAYFRLVLHVRK